MRTTGILKKVTLTKRNVDLTVWLCQVEFLLVRMTVLERAGPEPKADMDTLLDYPCGLLFMLC